MKIGKFFQDGEGIMHGRIFGLGCVVTSVLFEPQTSRDGKPYFKIIADPIREAYEVGAAFEKKKDGMTYYSVSLESPAFNAPLHAALFPDKNEITAFNLIWDRPPPSYTSEARVEAPHVRRFTGYSAAP